VTSKNNIQRTPAVRERGKTLITELKIEVLEVTFR
jgi:hypothetical protein